MRAGFRSLILVATHLLALGVGFALGVYMLPLLIAPPAPTAEQVSATASDAMFKGTFRRDLKGSDGFHWGEGVVHIGKDAVSFEGRLAPGPDYKLYLSPEYVETAEEFLRVKPRMRRIGDVKTFENFLVTLPPHVDPAAYTTVVVWCEAFSKFISAAKYRDE